MGVEQTQCFCNFCQRPTLHTRSVEGVNHLVHVLIAIFLCGLWLPVWLILVATDNSASTPFRCTSCGAAAGQLTPVQAAARQAQITAATTAQLQRSQAKAAAKRAALSRFWQGVLNDLRQAAVALGNSLRNAPGRFDRWLAMLAGDGNRIVHWFLRLLTVAGLSVAAVLALGLLF